MKQAVITYPESFPHLLKLSDREFAKELGFLAAAKIYELGRLTATQAARLAGMDRLTFLGQLHRVGAPAINLRDEEIEAEIEAAREVRKTAQIDSAPPPTPLPPASQKAPRRT